MAWKECIVCGEGFKVYNPQVKMCSKECSKIRARERSRLWAKKDRIVNPERNEKRNEKRRNQHTPVVKECVICGSKFEPKGRLVVCSRACSKVRKANDDREYREKNSQKLKEIRKKDRMANPDKYKKYASDFRNNNPEYYRERYWEDPEKYRAEAREYGRKNPEKRSEAFRNWCKNNPEKARNAQENWAKNNPEKYARNQVKSSLKYHLGVEPPADLIEEATALRLLNRALRNIS